MSEQEILFQQYKLYTEQKENFVERSFLTNKFYLITVLVIFLATFLTKGMVLAFGISSTLVFSAAGIAICALWWINVDSYNFLLKVKLGKVIEDLESRLPFKPYTEEFVAIKDLRKNKRMFVFADIQKVLAISALLLFFTFLVNEVVPLLLLK